MIEEGKTYRLADDKFLGGGYLVTVISYKEGGRYATVRRMDKPQSLAAMIPAKDLLDI